MSRILSFTAKDNVDLGHQLGEHFRERIANKIEKVMHPDWSRDVKKAMRHWKPTQRYFPQYADEVKAYAKAAGVKWQDLWTVGLELESDAERCTAMVTNDGMLIGHNEDYEPYSIHDLFLIKRTVGKTTVLDFSYFYSLGGNASSVNSNGWCQMINSVHGPIGKGGVPRNVIARWLSETKDPEKDFKKLKSIPRREGYSHTFVRTDGKAWNLETTATDASLREIHPPFVHTNHYLSLLQKDEVRASASSLNRFAVASRQLNPKMSVDALKRLMANRSGGSKDCIFNPSATVGKMIIDLKKRQMQVWFKAEPRKGFQTIPLDFLP